MPLPLPLPVPASGCGDACRRLDVIAKRLALRPVRATRRPLGRWPEMPLDHHRLDVYRRALALLEACDRVVSQLPSGRAHVRYQIDPAACSVVANIAEGAGEFSRKEKARFYRMARRSTIEVAAWLEIVIRRDEASEPVVASALQHAQDVVSMLVKLIHGCER